MNHETIIERKIRTAPTNGYVIHTANMTYKDSAGVWWKKQVDGTLRKWINKPNKAEKKAFIRNQHKMAQSLGSYKGCNRSFESFLTSN